MKFNYKLYHQEYNYEYHHSGRHGHEKKRRHLFSDK